MPCCTCLRSSYGYKATKVSKAKFVRMLNDNKEFAQYPVNFSAYTWNPEELDALCGALSATQYLTHLKYVAHRNKVAWWVRTGVVCSPGMCDLPSLTNSVFQDCSVDLVAAALRDNKSITKLSYVHARCARCFTLVTPNAQARKLRRHRQGMQDTGRIHTQERNSACTHVRHLSASSLGMLHSHSRSDDTRLPTNKITDKGVTHLATLLKASSVLTSLDVTGNVDITKAGRRALAEAMAANDKCLMRHVGGLKVCKFRKLFPHWPSHISRRSNNVIALKALRHALGYYTDEVRSWGVQQWHHAGGSERNHLVSSTNRHQKRKRKRPIQTRPRSS